MAHNHVVFETGVRYIFNPSLTMRTQFLPETSRVKKKKILNDQLPFSQRIKPLHQAKYQHSFHINFLLPIETWASYFTGNMCVLYFQLCRARQNFLRGEE